jgi:hypothetical protein
VADFDGYSWGVSTNFRFCRFVYWLIREYSISQDDVFGEVIKVEFPRRKSRQHLNDYRDYCRSSPKKMGKGLVRLDEPLNVSLLKESRKFNLALNSGLPADLTVDQTTTVGERLELRKVRLGQSIFSLHVRSNFQSKCCFPGCDVDEGVLLECAHIEPWAEGSKSRGSLSNGLCLCALHHKAFDAGLFVLTDDYRIHPNLTHISAGSWAERHLAPYATHRIRLGKVKPAIEHIRVHRHMHSSE